MKTYLAHYGCGPGMTEHFKLITNLSDDEIQQELYEMAWEHASHYEGMHGIGEDPDDYDSEDDWLEANAEAMESILEYGIEDWWEGAEGCCTYGNATEPETEEWVK